MTWNCRVIRKWDHYGEEYDYAIHEVFYAEDGEIKGWTENPPGVMGSGRNEIISDLEQKWEALALPILDLVPHPSGEGEMLVEATDD